MAQFRTTADLVDSVLRRSGELTDGTSSYESQALDYLNQVHHTIINGGNEFDVDVDEAWIWAKAKRPIILELQPALETGTVSLTQGSESGAFSSAPVDSQQGRFLLVNNREEFFRIAEHTAGAAAFELDGAYTGDTGAALLFKSIKLDYDLTPTYLIIDEFNDKLDFEEVASTNIAATLAHGSYTPAALATEVASKLNAAASATITVSFSAITNKFTLTSDLSGPVLFKLQAASGPNQKTAAFAILGYDDEDLSSAGSHESIYTTNGIVRFIEPMTVYKNNSINFTDGGGNGNIYGIDELNLKLEYPLTQLREGVPTRFAIVGEGASGTRIVRFNRFPKEVIRVEIEYIPMPRDLKDNTASIPLIPRNWAQILEFGAASYILIDKEDTKSPSYAGLAKTKLQAMIKQNRKELRRTGENFGETIARRGQIAGPRRLLYGEPK